MSFALPKIFQPYRSQRCWVNWKPFPKADGSITKPPYQPSSPHRLAKPNDPTTFGHFTEALCNVLQGRAQGLGLVFFDIDLIGFDLDRCIHDGEIAPWARRFVERARSYTEFSPSGSGLHVIGIGRGDRVYRNLLVPDGDGIEIETIRRGPKYFTLTGQRLDGSPDHFAELDALVDAMVAATPSADQRSSISQRAAVRSPPRQSASSLPAFRPKYSWRQLDMLIKYGEQYPHRSHAVWFVVNELLRRGMDDEAIFAILLDPNNRIGDHCREQPRGAEAYVRRQIARAREAMKA